VHIEQKHTEQELYDALKESDIAYITRVQEERFPKDKVLFNEVKDVFRFTHTHADIMRKNSKKKSIIMHPLPRVNELDGAVDAYERFGLDTHTHTHTSYTHTHIISHICVCLFCVFSFDFVCVSTCVCVCVRAYALFLLLYVCVCVLCNM